MNPEFCPSSDFSLYYNHTFMTHLRDGVVQVQVMGECEMHTKPRGGDWKITKPEELECLWPSPRSINLGNRAVYIGRSARREARKSATLNHYYVKYDSNKSLPDELNNSMMFSLCTFQSYPSLDRVLEYLREGKKLSVAITPDIILEPVPKAETRYGVVCCGEYAGTLTITENSTSFEQDMNNPPAKRAEFKLRREGIL